MDDRVICVADKRYANLPMTDTQLGYFARMQTPYINTTAMCLELYFRSQSTSALSKPVIEIIAIDEEKEEYVWASSDGLERSVWDRMFARLPDGVHQIVIEGHRSSSGYSGLSIDDVVVQSCDKFGNFSPELYQSINQSKHICKAP